MPWGAVPARKRAKPAKSGPATLWDRCPRGTPGRPPAGSEAPARAQPSLVSMSGGQSGDLAPREVGARLLPAGAACCGREPRPMASPHPPALGQPAPYRPTAPTTAQIAPPRSNGAGAAAPRPRRRPGAAPRPARGRWSPRRPPKAAKTGQIGPGNALGQMPQRNAWAPSGRV
jgi:hypothetical protein